MFDRRRTLRQLEHNVYLSVTGKRAGNLHRITIFDLTDVTLIPKQE
jgi:hypothetical protein